MFPAAPSTPELLAPAGSLVMMRAALTFGADAIYAGQPRYSLRVRNNEFGRLDRLGQAIAEAHAAAKKFYLVSNVLPHNAKVRTYLDDLAPVVALAPDALIMADPGLIDLVRNRWPGVPIHLSVQANTVNFAAVRFWQRLGIARIILSRELSLDEVAEIRQECPDIELEVFVHGALCVAYSGRCLLSGYFNRRDANQGSCTNACRWEYSVKPAEADGAGDVHLIEERERPGELMPIEEDEHGTYIMNSKDLRAVQHVERLVQMGVHSLKIEGRTKSHFYCARTTQVYRKAIDDAVAGKPFDMRLMDTLESLAHRGYTEGFLRRHVHDEYQNYLHGSSLSHRQQFVGEMTGERRNGLAEVKVKNRFALGDHLELMTPRGNYHFDLDQLHNSAGLPIQVAPGDGHTVYLPIPDQVDLNYALLMRDLTVSETIERTA